MSQLDNTLKELNKKYGSGAINEISKMGDIKIERIPTGSYSLDYVMGGGLPRGRVLEIYGAPSCQPKGSKVLMADGTFKCVENIVVGDFVLSPQPNGENIVAEVLNTVSWNSPRNYKIISRRKDRSVLYRCSFNHIIPIFCNIRQRKKNSRKMILMRAFIEKTAESIYNERKNRFSNMSIFTMPSVNKFMHKRSPSVSAYALGALLGDGDLSRRKRNITFTTADDTIIQKLEGEGMLFLGRYQQSGNNSKDYTISKNDKTYKWLKANKLIGTTSHTKFIPNSAKYASKKFRIDLLSGLLDTDGFLIKEGGDGKGILLTTYFDYSTTSLRLANDIRWLVHSLGGYCSIPRKRYTFCNNKKFKSYRLYISVDFLTNSCLKRKKIISLKRRKSPRTIGFDIEVEKGSKVYGMIIDSPSQWYITDNYLVTHNSGKTVLSLFMIKEVQKLGGKAAFIDVEQSFSVDFAKKIGVNTDKLIFSQTVCAEDVLNAVEKLTKTNELDIIVVDSVASMVPKKELLGEIGDIHVAPQARLMSQALRVITGYAAKTKTSLVFLNQLRSKIGVFFGKKETTSGGRALKFYSSVRIEVKKGKNILNKNDEVIGNWLKIAATKNKTAMPFRTAEFELLYEKGIDTIGDVLDTSVKKGIIKRGGSVYTYSGKKLGMGRNRVKKYLRENPEILKKIRKELEKTEL